VVCRVCLPDSFFGKYVDEALEFCFGVVIKGEAPPSTSLFAMVWWYLGGWGFHMPNDDR
jgi:hypothetical protein